MNFSGREFDEAIDTVPGPVFSDDCEHDKNAYVGTIRVKDWRNDDRKYDIYVFGDPQDVCLRYGNDPPDCLSPGRLVRFLQSASRHGEEVPHYGLAASLLCHVGKIVWKRNPT